MKYINQQSDIVKKTKYFLHSTTLFVMLLMLLPSATAQNDDIKAFEETEGDFIAQDMTEDEAVAMEMELNPLTKAGHSKATELTDEEIAEEAAHYHGWVADVVQWYGHHVSYGAVGALMAVESSFIPFPSEIVIPPAVMVVALAGTTNHLQVRRQQARPHSATVGRKNGACRKLFQRTRRGEHLCGTTHSCNPTADFNSCRLI